MLNKTNNKNNKKLNRFGCCFLLFMTNVHHAHYSVLARVPERAPQRYAHD